MKKSNLADSPQLKLPEELEAAFDAEFKYVAVALDNYTNNAYSVVKKSGEEHLDDLKAFAARCYEQGAEQMRDSIMLAGVTINGVDYIPWKDAERRSKEFFEEENAK